MMTFTNVMIHPGIDSTIAFDAAALKAFKPGTKGSLESKKRKS